MRLARRIPTASKLLAVVACLMGLAITLHPMVPSMIHAGPGASWLPGDLADSRFNHYVLEHGYRWVREEPAHARFWDAPFFHPAPGVLAYSDVLVGAAPLYWLPRALGFGADGAFALWIALCLTLDFAAMHLLLRRGLGRGPGGATAGAFLFAFAATRAQHLGHQQLLPQFFTPLAILELVIAMRAGTPLAVRRVAVLAAAMLLALQLWAGFYLGWFACLGLLALGLAMLARAPTRRLVAERVRADPIGLSIAVMLFFALVWPMLAHYREAAAAVGVRSISDVFEPALQSWLFAGPDSWLYGWQDQVRVFQVASSTEQRIGVGWVTLVAAIAGLWRLRRTPGVAGDGWRATAGASAALVILTSSIAGYHLWPLVFNVIPGAVAIRALARVALLLLIPLSIGLAMSVDHLARRARVAGSTSRKLALALLLGFVILEQGKSVAGFDPQAQSRVVARVAEQVAASGPRCRAFYLSSPSGPEEAIYATQLDAMWASLATGIPTLNGYSGNHPRGWDPGALPAWAAAHGLDAASICLASSGR